MPVAYLAGGCFWGVQAYYDRVDGVTGTVTGFAQSRIEHPTGGQIASGAAGAVETVAVTFDEQTVSLKTLFRLHLLLVEETPVTSDAPPSELPGVFWTDRSQRCVVESVLRDHPIPNLRVEELTAFEPSSQEQQHYLAAHPGAECHVPLTLLSSVREWQKRLERA